jgi:hypothetical protein
MHSCRRKAFRCASDGVWTAGSALCGLLGNSECEEQEARGSEAGVDRHADPSVAPPLDDVGQDQGDRHKGHQDLPRKGGVEQQPKDPIDQPSPSVHSRPRLRPHRKPESPHQVSDCGATRSRLHSRPRSVRHTTSHRMASRPRLNRRRDDPWWGGFLMCIGTFYSGAAVREAED